MRLFQLPTFQCALSKCALACQAETDRGNFAFRHRTSSQLAMFQALSRTLN